MDRDFAVSCPLVRPGLPHIRFLFVRSRLRSTLPSDPASRRRPCASLALHLHQAVPGTCTPRLSNMLGTQLDRRGRQGQSRPGHGTPTNRLWPQAERLWDQATAAEAAWTHAKSAFEFFTPEGRLNDRAQAEAAVAAALPHLSGAVWAKTRRLLRRRESFTFLDQVQKRLADLGLDPDVLSALLDLDGWRRQPWRLSATTRVWAPVRTAQLTTACSDWREEARRVRAVRRGVWHASSLVECVNSVARMQQARHRKMTQGLLDLKRLYGT